MHPYISTDLILAICFLAVLTACDDVSTKLSMSSTPIPRFVLPTKSFSNGSTNNKPRLSILASTNYGGSIYPLGPLCTEGYRLALDTLQRNQVLQKYELVVEPLDDRCDRVIGTQKFILEMNSNDKAHNRLPLTLGPRCPFHLYTGQIMKFYNFVGLTETSIVAEIYADRKLYSHYFLLSPPGDEKSIALVEFLSWIGWSRVAILSDTNSFWEEIEDTILKEIQLHNMTNLGTVKLDSVLGIQMLQETIEAGVRQLKESVPTARIIILNTNIAPQIACWLHRYGMYGPSYVFLLLGTAFFLPNDRSRFSWCTQQMLFEVLESIIFYDLAAPINLNQNKAVDSLGTRGDTFDAELKATIDQPDMNSLWWQWRTYCYDEVVAAGLALNATENYLQQNRNETLFDWLTNGHKFQSEGSVIQAIIRESVLGIKYSGLAIQSVEFDRNTSINPTKPRVAFYQMRRTTMMNDLSQINFNQKNLSMASLLEPVAIAIYNSKTGKISSEPGNPPKWQTADGRPPFDSIRYVAIKDPAIPLAAQGLLLVFAGLLLIATLTIFAIEVWQIHAKNQTVLDSVPVLNLLTLAGDLILAMSVFLMPADATPTMNTQCMVAFIFLNTGTTLIFVSIVGKLNYGCAIILHGIGQPYAGKNNNDYKNKDKKQSTTLFGTNKPRAVTLFTMSTIPAVNNGHQQQKPSTVAMNVEDKLKLNQKKRILYSIVTIWNTASVLAVVVWMSLDPLQVVKVDTFIEPSPVDVSVVYQHYTFMCTVLPSSISSGFGAFLTAFYGLTILRITFFGLLIGKKTALQINDLHQTVMAAYVTMAIFGLGLATIMIFTINDGGKVEICSSVIAIVVVAANLLIIFAPKLRRGYYF